MNGLARIMGINRRACSHSTVMMSRIESNDERCLKLPSQQTAIPDTVVMQGTTFQGNIDENGGDDDLNSMKHDVREIKATLESHLNRITEKEKEDAIAQEWRIFARVLDRIFFIIYLCIIIISLAIMFPSK